MSRRWLAALSSLMLCLSGCLYNARERADQTVCSLAMQPYDRQPTGTTESKPGDQKSSPSSEKMSEAPSLPPVDVQTTALTAPDANATRLAKDDQQPLVGDDQQPPEKKKPRLPSIPPEVPGSETPLLSPKVKPEELQRIYPKLPPLSPAPVALPGPNEKPYTLSTLQQTAAANSAQLHQAAYDVEAARGNVEKAGAYKNPTVGWNVTPSNDGSTASAQGPFIDQTITTAGKLRLAREAAEMDLRNAELALRRARSDLATQVRNAYFALLVAKETMRVNQAFAHFTDDIYRLYIEGHLGVGTVATHEPAALRAQAYSARLAYKQSIQAYVYAWYELVAAIGLRHLPLTEVAGRIDAFIPYFDYDTVLSHVLRNHTDVLTARNGLEKARYNLKLAQVTPVPDVDFNVSVLKEYSLLPKQFVHTVTIGFPFPIWDRNRGGIIAAQGALGRALEEPHRVEVTLTTTLATAYASYKQNLDAVEDYRRFILPDQVRYYRGVIVRRDIDMAAQFGDVVTAQQALATSISSYLTTLGSLWSSVVGVADLLQTDDLFQLGRPRPVPALPDLESLARWPCCHDCPPAGTGEFKGSCISVPPYTTKLRTRSATRDYSGVAYPEHDAKGVRTINTPFEDSGRAIYPTNNLNFGINGILPDSDSKRTEAPEKDQSTRSLSEHVLSGKLRRPAHSNDFLLDEPPPVPFVPSKQQPGSLTPD